MLITRKSSFFTILKKRAESDTRANVYRRKIEKIEDHPVKKGVENLFNRETLERAIEYRQHSLT